jgi:alpha-galactosidase/6-phospho-beta-glucosidase family protein
MTNICIIGASTMWTPGLATDLMKVFDEPLEIRLVDIQAPTAQLMADWGQEATKYHGRNDRFLPFSDRREALRGADAVLITISTGGLDAMEQDLLIPEKYGIFASVGDTCGPSGWSRALRNIPVFQQFARDFREVCPTAFIANYTNPMSALTATLQSCCDNPVVGLCHSYFEIKDVIQQIFALEDWRAIALSIAGMNHFTWVTDFKIGRDEGYAKLREKLDGRSLQEFIPEEGADEIGNYSGRELFVQLFETFGYLFYVANRHTAEFLSFTVSGHPPRRALRHQIDGKVYDTIDYCHIRRTSVEARREGMAKRAPGIAEVIRKARAGEPQFPRKSRETGAEMIHAYLRNKPFTDAVNLLNIGQVPGLPQGACCVETLGVVDGLGVRPLAVGSVPEPLLEVMRPQAICQKWLVEGAIRNDDSLMLQALYRDPQCAQLKPHEVRQLARDLVEANRPYRRG